MTFNSSNMTARFDSICRQYPLLSSITQKAESSGGLDKSTVSVLINSSIPHEIIDDYFSIMVRRHDDSTLIRYGFAAEAIRLYDEIGVGREAIDYSLIEGNLSPDHLKWLGIQMCSASSGEGSILEMHRLFCTHVKNDCYYESFLMNHVRIVVEKDFDTVMNYLLYRMALSQTLPLRKELLA